MADLSKIMIPDGTTYTIKDETARELADSKSEVSVSQTLTSGTEIASITVDGSPTKLYAPSGGGGGTAMTDAEVNTAVDDAFPQTQGKTVTVSLTNPKSASEFRYVNIYDYNDGMTAEPIGTIESAAGSLTVSTSKEYLRIEAKGASSTYIYRNKITVTGGVTLSEASPDANIADFVVDSDGTITIDGINYDW